MYGTMEVKLDGNERTCCFELPVNEPWTAQLMAETPCSVRLYKSMASYALLYDQLNN
jgi:hypothetical protein